MKLGWTYPERRKFLDDALKGTPTRTKEITFQGRNRVVVPILSLDIEFPKYRLSNGRTYALQAEYLKMHPEVDNDFFETDTESDVAQQVQHSLLNELISDEQLHEYFAKHEQMDPLYLDSNGIVVNGNRRLCSMREYYEQDKIKYSKYKTIDFIILPPASDEDIDDLEAQLQIHPDIKSDYGWVSEVLMYKTRAKKYEYDDSQIAGKYEIKEKELQELYSMLTSADSYLESRNKPGQYHLVQDRYNFTAICDEREKRKNQADKDVFEMAAYTLLDNPEVGRGRIYRKIQQASKYFDKIKSRLSEELEPGTNKQVINFGELGELVKSGFNLTNKMDDLENSKEIAEIVIDVIETEREKERHDQKQNAASYLITEALSNLEEAIDKLSSAGPSKINSIDNNIKAIESAVATIKKWLSANTSNKIPNK